MFDRTGHNRRAGQKGGLVTSQRYGSPHMRTIGKRGAQTTIQRHGYGYWKGMVDTKGYQRRPSTSDQFLRGLSAGRELAALAAD
jgi:hypothetical protein